MPDGFFEIGVLTRCAVWHVVVSANRLLELYTGGGGKFAGSDPTRLAASQLDLRVDEWANENDIETERRRLQSQQLEFGMSLLQLLLVGFRFSHSHLFGVLMADLAPLEPALEERLGRTKQLVVDLLSRISQGANGQTPAANIDDFLAVRALKSENLAYRDLCISVSARVV